MMHWLCALLGVLSFTCGYAAERHVEPAKLAVRGLGWWDNREQRVALERILGDERGPVVGAGTVEDAAFMIISALATEGFLHPVVKVRLTLADGRTDTFTFDRELLTVLPRALEATAMEFHVEEGVRSVIGNVSFDGLTVISEEEALGYFKPDNVPLLGEPARAYSPGRLRRSADYLQDALRQDGYAEAVVQATVVAEDLQTGEVTIHVDVREGARWMVAAVTVEGTDEADLGRARETLRLNIPWNHHWQQDAAEAVRREFYRRGHADVRIQVEPVAASPANGRRDVAVTLRVNPGPAVRIGEVRFEGNEHTRESVLRRRVRADEGDRLNPLALERSRFRLARLGAFETVDLRYEPPTGEVRDAVFVVDELPRWDMSLLAGYGSYEQLRGGVELLQTNLFGRAHSSRLVLVQSMKSTRAEYTYAVPELFGESVDGTLRLFGLRREEEAFDREEYGGTIGLRRRIPWLRAEGNIGYTYQSLKNADNRLTTRVVDQDDVKVASIDLGVTKDMRDNPLRPRQGYRWFARAELANDALGGEVDYQAFETGVSFHVPWGRSRWWHLGLTHGAITQLGAPSGQLVPVNRRFFPGGDSSIRGYQKDEAAPRGADDLFVGAETFTLLNAEIEQALTNTWSLVVFIDALGQAADLKEYPFNEYLVSAGLGVRYQTIVGPVRLEYGRNLNPRDGDPGGTLHFSVGFPF